MNQMTMIVNKNFKGIWYLINIIFNLYINLIWYLIKLKELEVLQNVKNILKTSNIIFWKFFVIYLQKSVMCACVWKNWNFRKSSIAEEFSIVEKIFCIAGKNYYLYQKKLTKMRMHTCFIWFLYLKIFKAIFYQGKNKS